ncbi:transposase [Chloroflexota bacterium]
MKPIYARPPTGEERETLVAALKSAGGITVRRSQIILISTDEKLKAGEIGKRLGLSDQLVRNVLHAFNEQGIACLEPGSNARKDDQRAFDDQAREQLREIIQQSPRSYGYETSLWTLDLLAEVSHKEGLTAHQVHKDTVSQTLNEMGMNWKRVKHWITSPDKHYERKKSAEIG